jgi:transcriptional regulator with XRE-family HTH domain
MTFGELIGQYLRQNRQTYQQFADRCHVSKAYISMLVNGKNPKTGEPIKPTIQTYSDIADAMGLTIDRLFGIIDDAPVALSKQSDAQQAREELADDPDRKALLNLARYGSAQDVKQVAALIDALRATNPDFYDGDDPA